MKGGEHSCKKITQGILMIGTVDFSDDYMKLHTHDACKAGEIWIKLVNCIDISSLVVILYCIYAGSSR